MAKTEIIKIKGDWKEVVNDCRATVGKSELGKEPSIKFKEDILIAEHDPIRDIEIKFRWRDIPYWIAMHWKTHIWRSRCRSQRNDRQDTYDRNKAPQDSPVEFIGDMNAQHGIDTFRKRLCRTASPETREYAEDYKFEVRAYEPEYSDVLVPNCIYRCGCPELNGGCGWFDMFKKKYPDIDYTDIRARYDAYNETFYQRRWFKVSGEYGTDDGLAGVLHHPYYSSNPSDPPKGE